MWQFASSSLESVRKFSEERNRPFKGGRVEEAVGDRRNIYKVQAWYDEVRVILAWAACGGKSVMYQVPQGGGCDAGEHQYLIHA